MTIYTGPVFEMARQQFQVIADHLEIPNDERARLLYPKRAIAVSCPPLHCRCRIDLAKHFLKPRAAA